jgi:hypothetical protein
MSRRTPLTVLPIVALAALAIGFPAAGHASGGQSACPGKSDQHKPVGAGSGRRVR